MLGLDQHGWQYRSPAAGYFLSRRRSVQRMCNSHRRSRGQTVMDGQSSRTLARQSVSLAGFPSWQRLSPICPQRRARHARRAAGFWLPACSPEHQVTRADLGVKGSSREAPQKTKRHPGAFEQRPWTMLNDPPDVTFSGCGIQIQIRRCRQIGIQPHMQGVPQQPEKVRVQGVCLHRVDPRLHRRPQLEPLRRECSEVVHPPVLERGQKEPPECSRCTVKSAHGCNRTPDDMTQVRGGRPMTVWGDQ